ncbi:MAG: hypothetical protein M3348_01465, partial [Acidobacteriota bacterium]|nr:hypothetical protein [Acidobacteriota bacterium]
MKTFRGGAWALAGAAVLALGLWQQPEARAQWATSGANTVTTNTGNVGIGNGSPGAKLTVGSAAQQDGWVAIEGADGGANLLFNTGGANRARVTTKVNGLHFQAYSAGWFRDDFFIRDDGNVGIGTTSPGAKLDVSTMATAGANNFPIVVANRNTAADSRTGILFQDNALASAYGAFIRVANNGVDGAGNMEFGSVVNSAYTTRLFVRASDGNVGVGTSSPNGLLDVYSPAARLWVGKSSATAPDSNTSPRLVIGDVTAVNPGVLTLVSNDTLSGNAVGAVTFANYALAAADKRVAFVAGVLSGSPNSGAVTFSTYNAGAVGERMRIDHAGNVGIGTASPTQRLEVSGGVRVSKTAAGTGGDLSVEGAITGGTIQATYQDVAEWVPSAQKLAAGTVVVLDAGRTNHVLASSTAYDTKVAGVVSAEPGVILGVPGEGKVKV